MDTQPIDPVIATFLSELRASLGPTIREIWLYGSRARGDAQDGSDYDMLLVAEGAVPDLRVKVQKAEWVCMERHNALVSSIVYTEEQWAERKQTPLGWNIQREGKLVA
jgi:predicted nucleotidyltransferase